MSLNDTDVLVYKKQGNKWTESGSLTEHGQRVTGIDWAPKSNRLVTCGAVSVYVLLYLDIHIIIINRLLLLDFRLSEKFSCHMFQ